MSTLRRTLLEVREAEEEEVNDAPHLSREQLGGNVGLRYISPESRETQIAFIMTRIYGGEKTPQARRFERILRMKKFIPGEPGYTRGLHRNDCVICGRHAKKPTIVWPIGVNGQPVHLVWCLRCWKKRTG